jgi:hypothetical protein
LPDTEILEVYDFLINGYEILQDKGAEKYTIKCDGILSIEEFKARFGIKQPSKVMADSWKEGDTE